MQRLQPDPRFNDVLVSRFVNVLMRSGNKSVAYRVFYSAIDEVSQSTKEDGYQLFKKALDNVMPSVEVRSRRVGGATFQIPTEIKGDRRVALGMKWLIYYARERKGKPMTDKLAAEIIAASRNEGSAVKKREDVHKMAEANRAFSHFRF